MRESLRDTLLELLSIPSLSTREQAISARVEQKLGALGLAVERDGDGNVTAWAGPRAGKLLVINGHLDTVPPGEGWRGDPYSPRLEGDHIVGLGASDMKSGLAVMLYLAGTLRPQHLRVAYAFTVNEEGGTPPPRNGVHAFLERHAPDFVLTTEGSYDAERARLMIGLGCQGRSLAEVTVLGRTAHSAYFRNGINAIYLGAELIRRVERYADQLRPQPVVPGVDSSPAMSVVRAEGGIAKNVIPDRFRLTIDRRLAVGEDFETFRRELDQLTAGIPCERKIHDVNLPTVANLEGPLYRAAREAMLETLGYVEHEFSNGRLDLCYFAAKTPEILNIGPGHKGQFHQPEEHVSITAMETAVRAIAALVARLDRAAAGDPGLAPF